MQSKYIRYAAYQIRFTLKQLLTVSLSPIFTRALAQDRIQNSFIQVKFEVYDYLIVNYTNKTYLN